MPFSKPTVASMSRESATKEAMTQRAGGRLATITNVLTQLPRQFFKESAAAAPHVMAGQAAFNTHHRGANNENILQPRLQHTLASGTKHARSLPTSPAMQEFASKCDDVMQRAQRLLERTKDQEQLLLRAIEERAASAPMHSPDHHIESPPPRAEAIAPEGTPQTPQIADATIVTATTTTTTTSGWFSWNTASPAMPNAPPPTPASCAARNKVGDEEKGSVGEKKEEAAGRESEGHVFSQLRGNITTACEVAAESRSEAVVSASPTPRLPHCPPPTPATEVGEDLVTPVRGRLSDLHAPHAAAQTPPGSGGGLFQRLFNSLQRLSGQPGGSPSPAPQPRPLARLFSPGRKSVHFVSPDKLESITPTKPPSPDDDEEAEERHGREKTGAPSGEERRAAVLDGATTEPARKRTRNETPSQHRVSIVVPPAPPPSAAKSQARPRSSSRARGRTAPSAAVSGDDGVAARKAKRKEAKKAVAPAAVVPPASSDRRQKRRNARKGKKGVGEETDEAPVATAASKEKGVGSPDSTGLPPTPRHSTEHTETLEFILHHSVKGCMAHFTKKQLLHFLHADGVLCQPPARTKRELLDEVRAVCGVK